MSRLYRSLVACGLVAGLACVFGAASPKYTNPRKPAAGTKPPVVVQPKQGARNAPPIVVPAAPKLVTPIAPKKVAPTASGVEPSRGKGTQVPRKLVAPRTPNSVSPRIRLPVDNPKISPKGTVKLNPLEAPNAILKLNPQPEPPGRPKIGPKGTVKLAPPNDSSTILHLKPQREPPGKQRTGAAGTLSLEGREKMKPLAVSKNGLMTPASPKAGASQLVDKARGLIESDKQKAAEREKILRGLFGVGKRNKTPDAEIMALGTDQNKSTPNATILPLGTDNPQEERATLMQFKERDNMTRELKRLKESPDLQVQLGLQHLNLDKISGVHQERLAKLDNFEPWQTSSAGQELGLKRQFELQTQGDLSRRLDLSQNLLKAGGWTKHRHHGVIASTFTASAFSAWYAGGGCYPAHAWCPIWSPWVDWCWWDTCPVFYDPRPYGCIPIVYEPCLPWVYHDFPVYPLPVVSCGTWIDVPPVIVATGQDVQLLAVRFVDNGHPEQNLGPRYRISARNNSPNQIVTPFSVLLLASNEKRPAADLPQMGVIVPSMDIGETQVFDIRLPLAAIRLGTTPQGNRVPFNYLHVLVDSHRQIPETFEDNNGAVLLRRDILPVDPAAFSTDLTVAEPASLLTIAGEGFGPEPGQVIVLVEGQQVQAKIHGWYDLGIRFAVPSFELPQPIEAEILVVRGDGAAANPLTVQLAPREESEETVDIPESPIPAPAPSQ